MATFPLFNNTVFVKQFQIGPGKFTYTVVQILYLDLKLSVTNDCQDEATYYYSVAYIVGL